MSSNPTRHHVKTTKEMILDGNWGDETIRVQPMSTDVPKDEFMVSIGDQVRLLVSELKEILAFAETEIARQIEEYRP
jgi:hypothetical protein